MLKLTVDFSQIIFSLSVYILHLKPFELRSLEKRFD